MPLDKNTERELDLPGVVPAKISIGDVPVRPPPVGREQSLSAVRVFKPTILYGVSEERAASRELVIPDECTRMVS
jgi:hypothetical protein